MINNVDYQEHDEASNSKKVTVVGGSITAAGQVTITPQQAWPDPKGYIGLVTVTGNLSASLGGNITINAGPNQIGSVTVSNTVGISAPTLFAVVNTSAPGISNSIVTVANVVSTTFSGNVTLDPGSKTGIVGNVTISDSKNFIGLTTSVISSLPSIHGKVAVQGNTAGDGTGTYTYLLVDGDGNLQIDIANRPSLGGNVTVQDGGGSITIDGSVGITGNVTLSDPKTYIGLTTSTLGEGLANIGFATVAVSTPTLYAVVNTGAVGITNSIVTVANTVSTTFAGNVTLDDGSLTGLVAGAAYIGLVTVANTVPVTFSGNVTISDSKTYIGLTTTTLGASPAFVGIVTIANSNVRSIAGNITLSNANGYIGLVTATCKFSNVTLSDAKTFIGLVTVGGIGTVTLADPKGFIGLTTSLALNAGTTKTLQTLPITLSTASIQTIFTPTTNLAVKVTNIILSSDATVRVSIKSGVTYLTGNASIGITLNPGGGFVQPGSPDAPVLIGCASGPLNVEKFDMTGTSAKIGGNITFFQE